MATQFRTVVDNSPVHVNQIITGLDDLRDTMFEVFKEADTIDFAFGGSAVAPALTVTVKTGKREDRDMLLFKMRGGLIPGVRFEKIAQSVETGARRRLTITAEVR